MEQDFLEKIFSGYKVKSLYGFDGFYVIEQGDIEEIVIDFVSNDFAIDELSSKTILFEVNQIAKFLNTENIKFNILVFKTAITDKIIKELSKNKYKINFISF